MKRRVIQIDQEKCVGCGICASACHEGAIGMVNGKATLLRDDYCDGLGNCLPTCPTGAISFIEREAAAYNQALAPKRIQKAQTLGCKLPSFADNTDPTPRESKLHNWPLQIKLAPIESPYFDNCDLLIAADCSPFAYANFHKDFLQGKVCLIGCPKLDQVDYTDKLSQIIASNNIKSVTIVRMQVPCCGGIEYAAKEALRNSGKAIRHDVITISTKGEIV